MSEQDTVVPEAPPEATVGGSAAARAWLARKCGGRGAAPVTLDMIEAKVRSMDAAQARMIGRVTRYGVGVGAIRPEDVPLEVAAEALWLGCDPVLQEALTAAMEILGLALNQVILGHLAFCRQELVNQDQSQVPQASYAVQYGTGWVRR